MANPDGGLYRSAGPPGRASEDGNLSSASAEAIGLLSFDKRSHNHASFNSDHNRDSEATRSLSYSVKGLDFDNISGRLAVSEIDLSPEEPREHTYLHLHSQTARHQDGPSREDSSPSRPALLSRSASHQQEYLGNERRRWQAHQTPESPYGARLPESAQSEKSSRNPHDVRDYSWLPPTLRWPFMLCLSILTLGLGALILSLTIFSIRNDGLVDEDSSAVLFFGWRFSPTLVAVIYSLLLSSLLLDIRRTEPYARLSREKGASGSASILFSLDQHWWVDPVAALSGKRNGGKKSWVYLLASVCSILGFLVISPLSSAFMAPASIPISRATSFNQLDFQPKARDSIVDDKTYFRVTSSYMLGVSTSAWVTDDYVIAPFWPSGFEGPPFGPRLATQPQDWHGWTTVFQAELNCEPLLLDGVHNVSRPYTYYSNGKPIDSHVNFTKVTLKSRDDCVAEYDGGRIHQSASSISPSLTGGGGWWANSSDIIREKSWGDGGNTSLTNSTFHPGSRSGCNRDSIIVIQSPLVWSKAGDFSVRAEACRSDFYSANVTASASNSAASSTVLFDEVAFRRDRKSLSMEDIGISNFLASFLTLDWNNRMHSPDQADHFLPAAGPLAMLAARYKMDGDELRTSSGLVRDAQQLHHRFFAERVQSVMKNLNTDSSKFQGLQTSVSSRITINPVIGVAIGTLLLTIMVALQIIFVLSRSTRRPLNLSWDPGSAGSIASIIAGKRLEAAKVFEGADRRSAGWLRSELKVKNFALDRGQLLLLEGDTTTRQGSRTEARLKRMEAKDWRPMAVKGWGLSILFLSIAAVLASIVALNRVSRNHGLYRKAYVDSLDISVGTQHITSLTPYSIIPTVIAVAIKLWWGALELAFKRLQPYISMTAKPIPPSQGLTLSYVSSPPIYSVGKAMKNRHWILAVICLGAFLTEVFTVGMSALCQESPRRVSRVQDTYRAYELRTVPQYYPYRGKPSSTRIGDSTQAQVIKNVYGNLLTNWIYGAALQLTLDGLRPTWTAEDWSFVPVDLTGLSELDNGTKSGGGLSDQTPLSGPVHNVTLDTPALRARLQCSPYAEIVNQSNWLRTHDLTNTSQWNLTTHPQGPRFGYELTDTSYLLSPPTYLKLADNKVATFYARKGQLTCCANETSDGPGKAAIGYWSKLLTPAPSATSNISVMWLVGYPIEGLYQSMDKVTGSVNSHWIWSEPPKLAGINCRPIIESADAEVTIDPVTSIVQSHTIAGQPRNYTAAWHEHYVVRNRSAEADAGPSPTSNSANALPNVPEGNITASFGWVFLDALLGSATVSSNTADPTVGFGGAEDLNDRTFNFRMKGFNLDFMSYSMLNQANNSMDALSDPVNLALLASNAFSVFFQHFVAFNISDPSASGGWAYQTIGARTPSGLGCPVSYLNAKQCLDSLAPLPDQDTNRTLTVAVHHRMPSIEFSEIAVWLCVSILAFLGGATVLVFGLSRAHVKKLPRDVDTVASVLGFVYGSWGVLEWVGRNLGERETLEGEGERDPLVKIGPFRRGDGTERWGVEIVGAGAGTSGAEEEEEDEEDGEDFWRAEARDGGISLDAVDPFTPPPPRFV